MWLIQSLTTIWLIQSPTMTWLIQCPTTMWLIQSPLRHGKFKTCYNAALFTKPAMIWHYLPSPLLHNTLTKFVTTQQYFYKISNNFYKTQILIWHLFTKAQILFWQLFHKAQILIWQLSQHYF